ncbi:hypothetical protein HGRIS_010812 [Hohenbuehelia grisea]|uniref:Hydrophobin n=1 Tax=Hohenbuehelia grisea TaxID=104357 RepID=A0ABR3IYN5_9AGAR
MFARLSSSLFVFATLALLAAAKPWGVPVTTVTTIFSTATIKSTITISGTKTSTIQTVTVTGTPVTTVKTVTVTGTPVTSTVKTITVTGPTTTATSPASQCNTGQLQCCNSVQKASSGPVGLLLGLLGVVLSDLTVLVGVTCTPINVIGAGGNSCTAQPVCCTNNTFNGIIAIGCTPINLNL